MLEGQNAEESQATPEQSRLWFRKNANKYFYGWYEEYKAMVLKALGEKSILAEDLGEVWALRYIARKDLPIPTRDPEVVSKIQFPVFEAYVQELADEIFLIDPALISPFRRGIQTVLDSERTAFVKYLGH